MQGRKAASMLVGGRGFGGGGVRAGGGGVHFDNFYTEATDARRFFCYYKIL